MKRLVLALILGVLIVLHTDLWLWSDGSLVLGLPVGLTYHVVYSLAITVLMAIWVRVAWPRLEVESEWNETDSSPRGPAS